VRGGHIIRASACRGSRHRLLGRRDRRSGLIDEARSIDGETIVSFIRDVNVTSYVVDGDVEGTVQSVGGDGSSLVGGAIFERALTNDGGEGGSGGKGAQLRNNDDAVVAVIGNEELVAGVIDPDSGGEIQGFGGGARRRTRRGGLSDVFVGAVSSGFVLSRSEDDDAIVGRIRNIEISFILIHVDIFGISESGRRSGTSFQGVEVGLAKNNLGGNSSGGLLADKVVPQHATGSTDRASELIGIKDVQGIVGCVIDDGLRTRQVEKADIVRRVPGNEVSSADDFDGTGDFAGEIGDRRIIVLEDATETVVNDPESVE